MTEYLYITKLFSGPNSFSNHHLLNGDNLSFLSNYQNTFLKYHMFGIQEIKEQGYSIHKILTYD